MNAEILYILKVVCSLDHVLRERTTWMYMSDGNAAKRGFTLAAIIAQQRAFMNFVKNISINLQVKPGAHS